MGELRQLSAAEYDRFRGFIYRQTGIAVPDGKVTLLSNRVRRRLRALGLDCFDAYYRLLAAGGLPGELERFIDAVTTNETSFFRTAGHFDWFTGPFIDDLATRPRAAGVPMRIWSTACSSGEEPYSLAICLLDNRRRLGGRPCEILGTDISETALAAAREARYERRSLETVTPEVLERHFTPAATDGAWSLRPEVTRMCRFRRHNLMDPVAEGPFDCIFVRNVLIYFDRASKSVVLGHLIDALAPAGYLVVGPAEGVHELVAPLVKRSTFLYQKP